MADPRDIVRRGQQAVQDDLADFAGLNRLARTLFDTAARADSRRVVDLEGYSLRLGAEGQSGSWKGRARPSRFWRERLDMSLGFPTRIRCA